MLPNGAMNVVGAIVGPPTCNVAIVGARTDAPPGSRCFEHGYRVPERAIRVPRTRRALLARHALHPTGRDAGARLETLAVARQRSPARLVIALSVAACPRGLPALLRRSPAAERRRCARAQLAGHTGKVVARRASSLARSRGDAHGAGLRFRLRDVTARAAVPGRLHGHRARPVQGRPRHRRSRAGSQRRLRRRVRARW